MKKKVLGSMMLILASALSFAAPAMADSRKVVTLGADLTQEQQNTMLRYFGTSADAVDIIYITNDDEREHLGSYVPLEQIGTRTFSCALVAPTTSGGIKVKTANLSWVTCNMIASTLSTSGVKNCQVVAASPFEVSGTGALTGVIMAYETASEVQLEPTKVELANEELVTTANLSDEVGQSKATAVINATKIEVVENNITDVTEITNIVNNISNEYNVDISADQSAEIAELMAKIAEQDYDITQLKATLERVQANVAADAGASEETQKELEENAVVAEEAAKIAAVEEAEETGDYIVFEDDEDESILDGTDVSALEESGVIVEEGDTTSTVAEQQEEKKEEDLGIPTATGDDALVEEGEENSVETVEEEKTSEEVKEEDLDSADKEIYTKAKDDLTAAFVGDSVVAEDGTCVYLTSEAAKKVPEAIEKYIMTVLVKGADVVAEQEKQNPEISADIVQDTAAQAPDEDFTDEDLKQIDKYVRRLVLKDSEKLLADSQLEGNDAVVIYNEIMTSLKKAFGVEDLTEVAEENGEVVDEGFADDSADEGYEEESVDDSQDEESADSDEFADFEEAEETFE